MKYVMFETPEGQKLPIIFPDALTHLVVSAVMQEAIGLELKRKPGVVSAGFVELGLGVRVHGDSESLGGLKSIPADAARMVIGSSIEFMPDTMAQMMLDRLIDMEKNK